MKTCRIHHDEKGFTLIETMICIFIVSICMLAVSRLQLGSMQANSLATRIINADLEASAAADYINALDFDNTLLSNGMTGNLSASSPFTIEYSVTDITPYGSTNPFHSILLTTTWSDHFGDHTIERTIYKLP